MRTARALAVAAALTGSALLSLPASAAEVCDRNCVGPLCGENCTRTPDVTVGRPSVNLTLPSRNDGVSGNRMWKLGENGVPAWMLKSIGKDFMAPRRGPYFNGKKRSWPTKSGKWAPRFSARGLSAHCYLRISTIRRRARSLTLHRCRSSSQNGSDRTLALLTVSWGGMRQHARAERRKRTSPRL
jgi:hypothetical protein